MFSIYLNNNSNKTLLSVGLAPKEPSIQIFKRSLKFFNFIIMYKKTRFSLSYCKKFYFNS